MSKGGISGLEQAWVDDHPVLDELRRRRDTGSTPRQRQMAGDGAGGQVKIGLAVEGGGMRGVISAAMLSALEDLGLGSAFDAVYGCSSGSMNGAYFLAGECWYPLSIYYDDLASKRFIDFRRPLRGQSIIDLDYVFDEIVERRKPLDFARVLSSGTAFHVAITSVERQATVIVADFEDGADLKATLRASSWLPGAVRGTTMWRGERAVDGGLLTAHPYALAKDDCTHVLSLSTHHMHAERNYNAVALHYACRYLDRIEPGLAAGYMKSLVDHDRHLGRLRSSRIDPQPGPYVLDLGPLPGSPLVKRHEMDRGRLIDAARDAYEIMYCAIEGLPVSAVGTNLVRAIPKFTVVSAVKSGPSGPSARLLRATSAESGPPAGRKESAAEGLT